MGSRAEIVEVVAGKDTVTSAVFVQIQDLLGRSRFKNIEVLHDELVFLGPADSQARLTFDRIAPLASPLHNLWIQQVEYFFVVDLQEADKDTVVASWFGSLHLLNSIVELVYASLGNANIISCAICIAPRRDSASSAISTLHREGLARASLSIGEDCPMVPL